MNLIIKLLARILSLPFVICIMTIAAIIQLITNILKFIFYGAELIVYEKNDKQLIQDIYKELQVLHNKIEIKKQR